MGGSLAECLRACGGGTFVTLLGGHLGVGLAMRKGTLKKQGSQNGPHGTLTTKASLYLSVLRTGLQN